MTDRIESVIKSLQIAEFDENEDFLIIMSSTGRATAVIAKNHVHIDSGRKLHAKTLAYLIQHFDEYIDKLGDVMMVCMQKMYQEEDAKNKLN